MNDMAVAFASGMPSLGALLEQGEIEAVLGLIEATWPEPVRRAQAKRAQAV